jgi:hypothetical protein
MQAPGDCARLGRRRNLGGPRTGRAIPVDDRVSGELGCGRQIAERPFDVSDDDSEIWKLFEVVGLHTDGVSHLGEAPGQVAKRAGVSERDSG